MKSADPKTRQSLRFDLDSEPRAAGRIQGAATHGAYGDPSLDPAANLQALAGATRGQLPLPGAHEPACLRRGLFQWTGEGSSRLSLRRRPPPRSILRLPVAPVSLPGTCALLPAASCRQT